MRCSKINLIQREVKICTKCWPNVYKLFKPRIYTLLRFSDSSYELFLKCDELSPYEVFWWLNRQINRWHISCNISACGYSSESGPTQCWIWTKMQNSVWDNLQDHLWHNLRAQVHHLLREGVWDCLWDELWDRLQGEVLHRLPICLWEDIQDQVQAGMWD